VRGFADALGHSDGVGEFGECFLYFDESLIVGGEMRTQIEQYGSRLKDLMLAELLSG
jgi:hypothetical protein